MTPDPTPTTRTEAVDEYIGTLPEDYTVPLPGCPPLRLINSTQIDHLAEDLQFFIANVIAALINAGSERDAVMENDTLYQAIREELHGWSDHQDNAPTN